MPIEITHSHDIEKAVDFIINKWANGQLVGTSLRDEMVALVRKLADERDALLAQRERYSIDQRYYDPTRILG